MDLRQLFIGSEGTLGMITEATLKLTRVPHGLEVFFFGVDDMTAVLRLFHEARTAPFTLMAFETLTRNCLEAVTEHLGLTSPLQEKTEAYVLMEVERPTSPDAQEVLDQWLAGLFEKGLVRDGTLAQSAREARDLWAIREGTPESIYQKGLLHKNDISLPVASLVDFVEEMRDLYAKKHSDFEVYFFGHIGDGNLHVNTLKPDAMGKEEFLERCHKVDLGLYELVQKYQGSISAEHGIGLLKKEWLKYSRSSHELAILKSMKQALDPQGLLNPGKIFD
jgi:FAD/FMN-containing dehydrogenase